jgi:hypothetical protein
VSGQILPHEGIPGQTQNRDQKQRPGSLRAGGIVMKRTLKSFFLNLRPGPAEAGNIENHNQRIFSISIKIKAGKEIYVSMKKSYSSLRPCAFALKKLFENGISLSPVLLVAGFCYDVGNLNNTRFWRS